MLLCPTWAVNVWTCQKAVKINLQKETDYNIRGFITIFQKRLANNEKVRLICLVDEKKASNLLIRHDLMSTDFPSFWIEFKKAGQPSLLVGGFYREWNQRGDKSVLSQIKAVEVFSQQIESATENGSSCVLVCSRKVIKWSTPTTRKDTVKTQQIQDSKMVRKSLQGQKIPLKS